MNTFTNWIETPENRPALLAIQRVAECVSSSRRRREANPVFVHGPSGTGKSHLLTALAAEATLRRPDLVASLLSASDLALAIRSEDDDGLSLLKAAREADLLILEDVHHVPEHAVSALVQLIDYRLPRQRQIVASANRGPGQLTEFPSRLTSRLASGLTVGLLPLTPASRRAFLTQRVRTHELPITSDIIDWLAEHTAGSMRQLEGALARMETLARLRTGPSLTLEEVRATFQDEADAHRPTVERIAQRVGRYYRLDPGQLQARDRSRRVLLPRQVGMYLARQLTPLSLQQIGAFFGGRDHSTVLHACRKVEHALACDPSLSGVVRQLHADLS